MASRQSQGNRSQQTQVETEHVDEPDRSLRLVGQRGDDSSEGQASRPRVTWTEETVDNENLNRKKSKICCIFHPNEEFCELSEEESAPSSSESSSSSESDSDSDSPVAARPPPHRHHHHLPRPNAYERQPRLKPRKQHAH